MDSDALLAEAIEERVSICEADGLSAEAVERAVEHTREQEMARKERP